MNKLFSHIKYTALSLLIIFAYSAAHAVINGVNVTVTASTLCNNGTIEKNFVGGCPGAWNEGALSSGGGNSNLSGRLTRDDIEYLGAFRITNGVFGDGQVGWSKNIFTVSPATNSFFLIADDGTSVGEFEIPELVNSSALTDLNFTGAPRQNFVDLIDKTVATGETNPDELDIISGMTLHNGKLIVNAVKYYDAAADNTDTTLIVDNPYDLANSTVEGFLKFNGAAFAAGWMTPIPADRQAALGGDYMAGYSSVHSIIGRFSVGPSAYSFDINNLLSASSGDVVASNEIMRYSINNPITPISLYNFTHDDNSDSTPFDQNLVLDNDIWTWRSRAQYGFIVPGTNTYWTIGSSGGHEHGMGYKITQEFTGNLCGGACPYYPQDMSSFVWLYDVDDLIALRENNTPSYDIQPYEYGPISTPFEIIGAYERAVIAAADYDYTNNLLYVVLEGGDTQQSQYDPVPLVLVYRFNQDAG